MLGSLTMLASGVLASSPRRVNSSGIFWSVLKTLREGGDNTAGERDVGRFDLHPCPFEVRSQDGQQRVRRERRRLVGLGPCELHICE